jgi:hypothetical protein
VDQDIISLDVPRSAEEAKQSMHFKDSMRERALSDIAAAWCRLVAAYSAADPATAVAVLDTVQRYVHWIDIGLVANDAFVPLLFGALAAPQEQLRGAAADVLTEIVRCVHVRGAAAGVGPRLARLQGWGAGVACVSRCGGSGGRVAATRTGPRCPPPYKHTHTPQQAHGGRPQAGPHPAAGRGARVRQVAGGAARRGR